MDNNTKWERYWKWLLENKKLENFVSEMDQVDNELGNAFHIEEICHRIYEDYQNSWKTYLEEARLDFLKILESFENVHLHTSRVKAIDSLLEKVITKRYESLFSKNNAYAKIDGENYKNIITDLIGMRIILNYRGKWKGIHKEVLGQFRYDRALFENEEIVLPHSEDGTNRLAQIPKVYYAKNDEIGEFQKYGLNTQLHPKGYRSIHYIISYRKVYIELQVRTIYDEAWSDCDHRYVYKQDQNKSHTALERLSVILCQLTNFCNDCGDNMKEIYETESYEDIGQGNWLTDELSAKKLANEQKKLYDIYNEFEMLVSHIQSRLGEEKL